jgi:hypothetical protein
MARIRRLDCRGGCVLVRVKLACGSTEANGRICPEAIIPGLQLFAISAIPHLQFARTFFEVERNLDSRKNEDAMSRGSLRDYFGPTREHSCGI